MSDASHGVNIRDTWLEDKIGFTLEPGLFTILIGSSSRDIHLIRKGEISEKRFHNWASNCQYR